MAWSLWVSSWALRKDQAHYANQFLHKELNKQEQLQKQKNMQQYKQRNKQGKQQFCFAIWDHYIKYDKYVCLRNRVEHRTCQSILGRTERSLKTTIYYVHDPSQNVIIITLMTTIIISKTAISYWFFHIFSSWGSYPVHRFFAPPKIQGGDWTTHGPEPWTESVVAKAPNITFLGMKRFGRGPEATHIMQHTDNHIISVVGLQNYPFLIIFTSPCARANAFSSCQVAKAFASSETTVIVAALGLSTSNWNRAVQVSFMFHFLGHVYSRVPKNRWSGNIPCRQLMESIWMIMNDSMMIYSSCIRCFSHEGVDCSLAAHCSSTPSPRRNGPLWLPSVQLHQRLEWRRRFFFQIKLRGEDAFNVICWTSSFVTCTCNNQFHPKSIWNPQTWGAWKWNFLWDQSCQTWVNKLQQTNTVLMHPHDIFG